MSRDALSAATAYLLARAQERSSRVVVSWPYGGLSVDVSGELVGGWACRKELRRCSSIHGCKGTHRGHYFLELRGLKPGRCGALGRLCGAAARSAALWRVARPGGRV